MKLIDWIKKEKISYSETARRFKIFNINPSANIFRYAHKQRMPKPSEMEKIYLGTNKEVEPNDFYDFVQK